MPDLIVTVLSAKPITRLASSYIAGHDLSVGLVEPRFLLHVLFMGALSHVGHHAIGGFHAEIICGTQVTLLSRHQLLRAKLTRIETTSAPIEPLWLVAHSHETTSDRTKLGYDGIGEIIEANADRLLDGSGGKTEGQ